MHLAQRQCLPVHPPTIQERNIHLTHRLRALAKNREYDAAQQGGPNRFTTTVNSKLRILEVRCIGRHFKKMTAVSAHNSYSSIHTKERVFGV